MNRIKCLHVIPIIFVFLNSNCQTTTKENQKQETKIEFQIFTEIPAEIDDCSCEFSKNEKDFDEKKYIFTNDLASINFIKLNGEMIKLELVESSKKGLDKGYYIYRTEEIKLRIDIIEKIPWGGIADKIKGLMTLTDRKGNKTTQEFFGACGC